MKSKQTKEQNLIFFSLQKEAYGFSNSHLGGSLGKELKTLVTNDVEGWKQLVKCILVASFVNHFTRFGDIYGRVSIFSQNAKNSQIFLFFHTDRIKIRFPLPSHLK